MAESAVSNNNAEKRYAVVTGANKGIGYGIVEQLAATKGIVVVLTARDVNRGLEAIEKLKSSGISSDNLLFHQLDVSDSSSVASLAQFINSKFGKLDILVNNAGVAGMSIDIDAIKASANPVEVTDFVKYVTQNYELAAECIQTNYYGAKKMTQAFIPLLQKSKSPRIVNVSASAGLLKDHVPEGQTKEILTDIDNLTEDKIDQVLDELLQDMKNNALVAKGWTGFSPPYTLTKAAVNAYTRIVAKKYPDFKINSVCPGFTKTDLNVDTGKLSVEEAAAAPVKLALLPDDGPSGLFFRRYEVSDF